MENSEYEKLLEKAYSSLPQKTASSERFEVPSIESFIQGNKTIIKNFDLILQKIRRPVNIVSKYFSRELAVPVSYESGRLILHGKFYERILKEKLNAFVESTVICKECKRPDTKILEIDGVKTLVCEACGARSPVKI